MNHRWRKQPWLRNSWQDFLQRQTNDAPPPSQGPCQATPTALGIYGSVLTSCFRSLCGAMGHILHAVRYFQQFIRVRRLVIIFKVMFCIFAVGVILFDKYLVITVSELDYKFELKLVQECSCVRLCLCIYVYIPLFIYRLSIYTHLFAYISTCLCIYLLIYLYIHIYFDSISLTIFSSPFVCICHVRVCTCECTNV